MAQALTNIMRRLIWPVDDAYITLVVVVLLCLAHGFSVDPEYLFKKE